MGGASSPGVATYRARSLLAALVLAAAGGPRSRSAQAAECGAINATTLRVESPADAQQLNVAVNCSNGGQLDAVWAGSVTLDSPISIGAGTFLSVTGEGELAEVQGTSGVRIFDVSPGGGLSLAQLKLSNGSAQDGGAIRASMGTVTLDNCSFEGNTATSGDGGAVWVEGGELKIIGGHFLRNTAGQFGGAVLAIDAGLTVESGARFEENRAIEGGAIYCGGVDSAARLTVACSLSGAEFISNNASGEISIDFKNYATPWTNLNGGGAATFVYADVDITDTLFIGNYAQLAGGALYGGNSTQMTIVGSTFLNNTTPGYGGGVAASSATLGGDTELRSNAADRHGGAVFSWNSTGTISFEDVNCSQNTAIDNGGCFYAAGKAVTVSGTSMEGNVAELGGCIYANAESDVNVDGGNYSCESTKNGGFLFATDGSRVNITAGLIANNVAARRAGAVYCSGDTSDLGGSKVFIEGGVFVDNEALELGGAIVAWGAPTVVTITGGVFKRNIAKFYGGFIFLEEKASMTCEGATVEENCAGDQGGGIYARESTWVNSSCDITGNESPQGAAAYLTHVDNATLKDMYVGNNAALGGSVVFIAETHLVASAVKFDSGSGQEDESSDRAVQMDGTSTFFGDGCVFRGWRGDTVVHSQSPDKGSLVLDSCDFSESSAVVAVVSPYSDAEVRNAVIGDLTLVNAVLDPLQLVDRALDCDDPGACGAGECVDSSLGVLCECLASSGGDCLDDGGALSVRLLTPPDSVKYSPNPVEFELLVKAGGEGATPAIWELTFEAVDLDLTVVPSSGVLLPGGNITVQVTGVPVLEDVGGDLTSRFELASVGSDGGAGDVELLVNSTFYLCRSFEYAAPAGDGDTSVECLPCDDIVGKEGVDCSSPGATLASLPIQEGFWRSDTDSLVILDCVYPEACAGATKVSSSDEYCAEGYQGPYCAVCTEGFGKGISNSCHSCENEKSRVLVAGGALFSLVILVLLLLAVIFLVGGLDAVATVRRSVVSSLSASMKWSKTWGSGRGSINTARVVTATRNSGTDSLAVAHVAPAFNLSSEQAGRGGDKTVSAAAIAESEREVDEEVASVKSADTAVGVGLGLLGAPYGGCGGGCGKSSGRLNASRSEDGVPGVPGGAIGGGGGGGEGGASGGRGCCSRLGLGEKIKRLMSRLPLNKLKILVVVWQILTVFPSITAVDFPPSYSRFLSWIDFVNLDLGSVFSASCMFPAVGFYQRLLVTTLLPLVLVGVMVVTYQAAKRRAGIGTAGMIRRRAAWSRHMAAGLLLTFLVFTSASTVVFKTFACDEDAIEGESYLRADYSLSCDSDMHVIFMVYAGLMLCVYPIGIPALYLFILWTHRHSLNPRVRVEQDLGRVPIAPDSSTEPEEDPTQRGAGGGDRSDGRGAARKELSQQEADEEREEMVRLRRSNPDLVPSMFLWKDFGPGLYYYEVIECGRRILLTGALIFISPYTSAQAAMACIFAFASLLGFELLRPHLDPIDSWLYRLGCVVIFLSNFLALLIKVDAAGESKRSTLGGLLVAVNVLLVLAVLFTSWFATQQQVDDSQDDENMLTLAQTVVTAEKLAAQDAARTRGRKSSFTSSVDSHRRHTGSALIGAEAGPARGRQWSGREESASECSHADSRSGSRVGGQGRVATTAFVEELWQRDQGKEHGALQSRGGGR